jgi:hypothetical protein
LHGRQLQLVVELLGQDRHHVEEILRGIAMDDIRLVFRRLDVDGIRGHGHLLSEIDDERTHDHVLRAEEFSDANACRRVDAVGWDVLFREQTLKLLALHDANPTVGAQRHDQHVAIPFDSGSKSTRFVRAPLSKYITATVGRRSGREASRGGHTLTSPDAVDGALATSGVGDVVVADTAPD